MIAQRDRRTGWNPLLKRILVAAGALVLVLAVTAANTMAARPAAPAKALTQPPSITRYAPKVVHATHSDTSPPLRAIQPVIPPKSSGLRMREVENVIHPYKQHIPEFMAVDTVVQRIMGPLAMPTPSLTFEGYTQQDNYNNNNGLGVLPPDTEGDVGPNHYVQWVNVGIKIFDKSGGLLFGPVNGNTIWSGFVGTCAAENNGDPVVLYDQMANRWLLSQFSVPGAPAGGPSYECIAISTTGDPTGSYYRYEFETSATAFEDYPHLGVWPDAYYMTTNEFTGLDFTGASNYAFERAKMLVGDSTATMQSFHLDPPYGGMLPTDLDGATPPPAGSPNIFMEADDDAFGYPQDQLSIFKFHVDWATPANSTFTGPINVATAPFDSEVCTADRGACVPQPGTTAQLEVISDRTMWRQAYRNFGDHEALVVNHTVDADGTGHAGIRWYELRNLGGTPTIYQQGTYAPDANHRWMGSAAMDGDGNLAVGYSVSSSTLFPTIRYAGRLSTDPLGTLAQGEATLRAGGGSQTDTDSPRWGDYSMMGIDPVDDCTFWYTQEYYASTSSGDWTTRIGRFKFPSCGLGTPTPTVTGTPPTATPTPPPTNTPSPTSTPACFITANSTDVPKIIPDAITITSTLTITNGPTIASVDVINLAIGHTWPEDLNVFLISPMGTRVELFTDVCGGDPDWTQANTGFTLSDSAVTLIGGTCPPGQGTYQPEGSLSALIGQPSSGTWTLEITDDTLQDNGNLYSWGLRIGGSAPCTTSTPAPTRTGTPTNTPIIGAVLTCHVNWEARPDQPNAAQQLPITLSLRSSIGTSYEYTGMMTDASGFFTVSVAGLLPGSYSYRVKGPNGVPDTNTTPGFLAKSGSLILTGAPANTVEIGLMKAGDANNDNVIGLPDFNILKNTFGRLNGMTGYDNRADFTGDELVSLIDFNALKREYGQLGDGPVGPTRH